jgi:hypothetical protein
MNKPVPPLWICSFKVKVRLLRVVHGIAKTCKTLNYVKGVPDAAENFIASKRKDTGHETRMMSLNNPNSIINYKFSFQSLNL